MADQRALLFWETDQGKCVECQVRHHPGWGCPKARKRRDKAEAAASRLAERQAAEQRARAVLAERSGPT